MIRPFLLPLQPSSDQSRSRKPPKGGAGDIESFASMRPATIQRKIDKAIREAEKVHSLLHPTTDPDPTLNLFNARDRRADAVRMTVLQMSMAIESILDGLFFRAFVGHEPGHEKRGNKRIGIARELDELLNSGRMGFDSKIKLARVLRILTKGQQRKLDTLRALRNKCAHQWMLDVVRRRGYRSRPTIRLLEFEGRNLHELAVLEEFVTIYSGIYLKLFSRYVP